MKEPQPPKWAVNWLETVCPEYLFEGILGDLEEEFYYDVLERGEKKARRRFVFNVLRFMHPEILLRNKPKLKIINNMMFSNYLKIAGRNMAKRKLFSFINAIGLSIGIAFCILIYLFIADEKSFDQFHVNKDRLFRIEEYAYNVWNPDAEDKFSRSAYLQLGLGPVLKEEVPQVEYAARFDDYNSVIVTVGDKIFSEDVAMTDPDFFKMFSFPVIAGNTNELLKDQYEVVITPEIAEKYFGTTDVLGKTMQIEIAEVKDYTITGLIESPPANSSLQFDMLMNIKNRRYYDQSIDQWSNFNTPTFVQLYNTNNMDQFDANLASLVKKYMAETLERRENRYEVPEGTELFQYVYTTLSDIHLNTEVTWTKSSDPQYSYILGGIALLILLIACINYISLSLTTSAARQTEVGVRKAIGAQRGQLIGQFTLESVVLALISMIFGVVLMVIFLPYFNEFTNKEITLDTILILKILGLGITLALVIGLISGSYPAFFLSSVKPSQVLKGGFTTKLKAGFTKPLVVLQFALSAFLIISSVIMYNQMEYVTTKDLGYNQDQILVMSTQFGWNKKSDQMVGLMRNALSSEPGIESVAGTSLSFNNGWSRYGYTIDGENKSAYVYCVDPYYIDVLDIELKEGRNFDLNNPADTMTVIINEALAADMGWENPLQEHLNWRDDTVGQGFKVIGVAKDYHFRSLEREIEPMFLTMSSEAGHLSNMLIKLEAGDISNGLATIEKKWKELAPEKPFDYSFLDEDVACQYESYKRWMSIMGLSTFFAILISCLGLFGLAGINALNRTKEIGIRKVFGAGTSNIFVLLNQQFLWLAIIAFGIATPASWYIMEEWLSGFEYGISLSWYLFAVSMLVGLAIAMLTVSYHAIKAASINPARTLKYE